MDRSYDACLLMSVNAVPQLAPSAIVLSLSVVVRDREPGEHGGVLPHLYLYLSPTRHHFTPLPSLDTQAAAAAGPSTDELLTARFNQDHSCLAVGTRRGYQIFACEPFTSCHASTDGAGIAVLEMLHSSSLVALVSAGERPGDSPRRLRLWNTRSNASICDLNFSTAVLAVRMNKARLLAVLEAKLHIFELSTMKLMHTLETTPNPRGLGELCADAETCHCVVPAAQQGQVLYFDSLQLHALNTVQAHKGPLGCLCLSSAGHLLATASEKGTVIRIHSFPQGALLHTFRRGSLPATICSLSFSPGVLLAGKREQARRRPTRH